MKGNESSVKKKEKQRLSKQDKVNVGEDRLVDDEARLVDVE